MTARIEMFYSYRVDATQDEWWALRTLLTKGVNKETLKALGLRSFASVLADKLTENPDIAFKQVATIAEPVEPAEEPSSADSESK